MSDVARPTRHLYVSSFRVDVSVIAALPQRLSVHELACAMARALEAGGAPRPASIGLVLTDDRETARLNRRHMGHRGPTDVLSFPLLEPAAFPRHRGQTARASAPSGPEFGRPPGRRVHLGDVVVSVDRAIAQAEQGRGGQTGDVRWSPRDELRLLVTHGALHICGWDHAESAEEAAMRELERSLLERQGVRERASQ